MTYFCTMDMRRILSICLFVFGFMCMGQAQRRYPIKTEGGYLVPMIMYDGEIIPAVDLPNVYVFKPLVFKNQKQQQAYTKLVRDVKKVLPIANEINAAIIETYEYLQTLPDSKAKNKHIKALEKGLKAQYTPQLKKLTLSQGKLLIKLIDRQNNQTSYELVKAFLGSFKAGFYQAFAWTFGASLKKEYDPTGDDELTERVILQVISGQL